MTPQMLISQKGKGLFLMIPSIPGFLKTLEVIQKGHPRTASPALRGFAQLQEAERDAELVVGSHTLTSNQLNTAS